MMRDLSSSLTGKKLLVTATHAFAWLALLSLPYLFKPQLPNHPRGTLSHDLLMAPRLANGILLVCIFYFNYFIAIPKLYIRKKYLLFFGSFLGCFLAFFLLNYSMMPPVDQLPPEIFPFLGPPHNLFLFIIAYILSFTTSMFSELQATRQQRMQTEISFLKAQINPHFLFNTLNSIYSLALVKSDDAPDAVVKLSGLMRYAISESDRDKTSLDKELDYINNYIELQKIRLPKKVKLYYEVTGDSTGKQIAPFILITFIENAFKYGVNAAEDSDISINIQIEGNSLQLQVINNKVYVQQDNDNNTGPGIENTRLRLKMLYPSKHVLNITDADDNFMVSLKLNLA